MAQGKNRKLLNKRIRQGDKGFPVATIAFYGPDRQIATKLVCGVIPYDGAEPIALDRWFSKTDIRHSEPVLADVLGVIENHQVKTVVMMEQLIGCPHEEEGVDYPDGESCPVCPYWAGRDRFTGGIHY